MKRLYLNQGSGGQVYSKLQVADGSYDVEKKGQLSFMILGDGLPPGRSVILDAEQVEDLRRFLNERAISSPETVPAKKIIVE